MNFLIASQTISWLGDEPSLQLRENLRHWTLVQSKDVPVSVAVFAFQDLNLSIQALRSFRQRDQGAAAVLVVEKLQAQQILEAVNHLHVTGIVLRTEMAAVLPQVLLHAKEQWLQRQQQERLRRDVSVQNRRIEEFNAGLEEIVRERTRVAEESRLEAEIKVMRVRRLVRFIDALSTRQSGFELLELLSKELRTFPEVIAPLLAYQSRERVAHLLHWQGRQVVEMPLRETWIPSNRLRLNDPRDQEFLANQMGRPVAKLIAIPLSVKNSILFVEHNLRSTAVEAFLQDITEFVQPLSIAFERIVLEQQLKQASLQWESTFDGISDPIAIVDIDYRTIRSNRSFAQGSYLGFCHQQFAEAKEVCAGCPAAAAMQQGQPQQGRVRIKGRTYEVYSYPILSDSNRATNVINHYVDVSADMELHSRVLQNEKMAAIGQLAGNIAHELNNPLTGIRSLAQILQKSLPAGDQVASDLTEVERAAERCQRIIENLLDFAVGGTVEKQTTIELNALVQRTLPMLKTAMREHQCQLELSEKNLLVRVEPHLFLQVVFNLVNNACQAMHKPGVVQIVTDKVSAEGKEFAELRISDTGPGIPSELQDSIFQPFFTTKAAGQGTGLGLSMSRSVVEKFGGSLQVESQTGKGAHFFVRLPLVR